MITLSILWVLIAGTIWRRVLGGLFHLPRSLIVACYPLVLAPAWFYLPWQMVAFGHVYAALYWLPGHLWTDLEAMVGRYGPVIGPVWYWIAKLPDRYKPTEWAELVASAIYHGVVAVLISTVFHA